MLAILLLTSIGMEAKPSQTAAGPPGILETKTMLAHDVLVALPDPGFILVCPVLHVELETPAEVVTFLEAPVQPAITRTNETDLGKPYNTVRTEETVLSLISYKNLKSIFRLPPMHNLMC